MADVKQEEKQVIATQVESAPKALALAPTASTSDMRRAKTRRELLWFHLTTRWHRFVVNLHRPFWVLQQIALLVLVGTIVYPAYVRSHTAGWLAVIAAVALTYMRVRKLAGENNTQLVRKGQRERAIDFQKLILRMPADRSTLSAEQIEDYQRDVLVLIAKYVRAHREDTNETEIFANLLVPDRHEMVVVARDSSHRKSGARYLRDGLLVAKAFDANEVYWTGDVQADYGLKGKPYKSVIAMPVRDRRGNPVGVVSIDSKRTYHFDIEAVDLEVELGPYLALLAWTLDGRSGTNPLTQDGGANGNER